MKYDNNNDSLNSPFSIFDDMFNNTRESETYNESNEDGTSTLILSVLGHNPANIKVTTDGSVLKILGEIPKGHIGPIAKVNYTYTVGKNTRTEPKSANIKNGLLTLIFEPVEKEKTHRVKITY